jgi:WD40 repeat protein
MAGPGQVVAEYRLPFSVGQVAWSPDRRSIFAGASDIFGFESNSGGLVSVDVATGQFRWQLDNVRISSLAVHPNAPRLAVSCIQGPTLSNSLAGAIVSGIVGGTPDQPVGTGNIKLLDATSGEPLWEAANLRASELVFSPDGQYLAANNWGDVYLLDPTSGAVQHHLNTFTSPFRWTRLAFSSDSTRLLTRTGKGSVGIFDTKTGTQQVSADLSKEIIRVAFAAGDNGVLVVSQADAKISVLSPTSGAIQSIVQMEGAHAVDMDHVFFIGITPGIAVSPGHRRIAAICSSRFGVFRIDDGRAYFPPRRLGSLSSSSSMIFSPTGRQVAVVDRGVGLVAVNTESGSTWWEDDDVGVLDMAFSPDGVRFVACGKSGSGGYLRVCEPGELISERDVGNRVTSIEMSPVAGTPLVGVADSGGRVTVLDAASGARLADKPGPGVIGSLAFAEGGSSIAVGGTSGVRLYSIVGSRTWTVDDIGPINAIAAVGPGGEWIATAAGRNVQLFSSATGAPRWLHPNNHPNRVTRLAASGDGRWIATGCADRKTRILDALTGQETLVVDGGDKIETVIFAPNSSLAATINDDGTIVIIDAASATRREAVVRPFPFGPSAFSFDHTMIAAAGEDDDNTVLIYDVTGSAAPRLVQQIACPAPVLDLGFNPADNTIAILTSPSSLVVRDPRSGVELVRVLQRVDHFAFSADGTLMATADETIVRVFASTSSPKDR